MSSKTGFYAYSSQPSDVGQCIERAVEECNRAQSDINVKTWTQLDIIGHFISTEVLKGIDEADFFLADITSLNFNVTYEIGYAIGKSKRILLTKNKSIDKSDLRIEEVGIFDTLGYKEYQNSSELRSFILEASKKSPLELPAKYNRKAPVYLL